MGGATGGDFDETGHRAGISMDAITSHKSGCRAWRGDDRGAELVHSLKK